MKRETVNIIQLGFGFCFIYTAMNSQAFIVEPVLASYHSYDPRIPSNFGYTLMSISSISLMVGNFFAPSVIRLLGSKWSLFCSSLSLIGCEFMNKYYFISISLIGGFLSGALWAAMGEYILLNSKEDEVEKYSGLAWLIYMLSYVFGGLFLLLIFLVNPDNSYTPRLIRCLFAVLAVVSSLGCIAFFFLQPRRSKRLEQKKRNKKIFRGVLEEVISTTKLLFSKDFLLQIPISMFSGFELILFAITYPTVLQFTQGFSIDNQVLVALSAVAVGSGEIAAGIPLFLFGKGKLSYKFYINLCCLLEIVTYILIYINTPNDSVFGNTTERGLIKPSVVLALLTAFLMGVADAILNVMTLGFISQQFPEEQQSTIAYSLRNMLQAISCAAMLYVGSYVGLYWQLLFISIVAMISAVTFFAAEVILDRKFREDDEQRKRAISDVEEIFNKT